jgi:DNA polymerase V
VQATIEQIIALIDQGCARTTRWLTADKLRAQGSCATQVLCFIRTRPFREKDKQYSRSIIVPLRRPTDVSFQITQAAVAGLQAIYRPGYKYAKAGVMLLDLQNSQLGQQELDLEAECSQRSGLMSALDQINQQYGRGTVRLGSARIGQAPRNWGMKQERRTPRYTTVWEEMVVAG